MRKAWFIACVLLLAGCSRQQEKHVRLHAPAVVGVAYTGSMLPTYKGGEMVNVAPVSIDAINAGDVIVYWEDARQLNIMHRVIRVVHAANGETGLLCRGDNNSAADSHIVTQDNLVGLVTGPVLVASH